jgi:hypothetical protein
MNLEGKSQEQRFEGDHKNVKYHLLVFVEMNRTPYNWSGMNR